MRLIYPIITLFLLISAATAQLSPDKERFDVVLHPGEVEEKTLKITNIGDSPISKITSTQVSGDAKEFIYMGTAEEKKLQPQDEEEIKIFFAIPRETKPGTYTGFIYLLDNTPPSLPLRIEFSVEVVEKQAYGLDMTIDDARSAKSFAKADDPAKFELSVKNLGRFRDVASIDAQPLPEGWSATLLDGETEHSLPYDLPLDPGVTHTMKLHVRSSEPGKKGELEIKAESLGNLSQNSSVNAQVEFGMTVRGYNVEIEVPDKMVANKTYKGSFEVILEVKEKVLIGIVTPPELMVIPLTQVVEVTPEENGIANFTMLASQPGEYPLIFKLMDSHGIPMPEELTHIQVVRPEGVVILTGDDFIYSTVASLCSPENKSVPTVTLQPGKLSDKDRENLQTYAKVIILGNESVVPAEVEGALAGAEVKRIVGANLCEATWRFTAEMWQNGTTQVVLSSPKLADIFKAYQVAKLGRHPLVICDGPISDTTKSTISDLISRNDTLSKALTVGVIGNETIKTLQGLGVSIEEVAQ